MSEKLLRTCDHCGADLNELGPPSQWQYTRTRFIRMQECTRDLPVVTGASTDPRHSNLVFCGYKCASEWLNRRGPWE